MGTLLIQDNLVGVDFKPHFHPKVFLQRSATSTQLKRLAKPSTSQQHRVSVESWLASNWDIHLDKLTDTQKHSKQTSKPPFPTQKLLNEFEKYDERYSGVIDLANFKTCLKRVGIEPKDTTQ